MKYIKLTIDYIKNNFVMVLLHAIIPAAFFTIFINPAAIIDMFVDLDNIYDVYSLNKFVYVFKRLLCVNPEPPLRTFQIIGMIATILITSIIISSLTGNIQNRMRYGETVYPGMKGFLKRVNNNFIPFFKCVIGFCSILVVYYVILAFIVSACWIKVGLTATIVVSSIFAVLLGILSLAWLSFDILILPNITMRGYGYFKSTKKSVVSVTNDFWRIFLAFFIPMIIFYLPVVLTSVFSDYPGRLILKGITQFVFYILSICYLSTLFYVVFFDIEEINREDLTKNAKWEAFDEN